MKKEFFKRHLGLWIFFTALALHLWKIQGDLPFIYNSDEPHHLNIAARFGTGDLNPHDFKYPTLWSYVIAVFFGLLFVAERLAGVVHTTQEFAVQYMTHPTAFYLLVRIATALFVAWAIKRLTDWGTRWGGWNVALVGGLLAIWSPSLLEQGREGTPYALMLILVVNAFIFIDRVMDNDQVQRHQTIAGLLLGLAFSTHYLAAFLGVLLLAPLFSDLPRGQQIKWIAIGVLMMGLGFLIGTPFALLDPQTFLSDLRSMGEIQQGAHWSQSPFSLARVGVILRNLLEYIDGWGIGFLFVVVGFWYEKKSRQGRFLFLLLPAACMAPLLFFSHFGDQKRYTLHVFLPLFIIAASGFALLWRACGTNKIQKLLLSLILFLPMLMKAQPYLYSLGWVDTRTEAHSWMKAHVATGTSIFVMNPYNCPQFLMTREQANRLHGRTQQINHPRADYYRILRDGHPGGGYEIYYYRRSLHEVMDTVKRTEASYQAQDALDLDSSGIQALSDHNVSYAIINPHSDSSREKDWIRELKKRYNLVFDTDDLPGRTKGPHIEIIQLKS